MKNLAKVIVVITLGISFGWFLNCCQDMPNTNNNQPSNQSRTNSPRGLFEGASQIWPADNGKPVSLADNLLAKNYYIVLDGSGSMDSRGCSGDDSKSVSSKKALIAFMEVVPAEANLGLLVFDSDGINERVPLGTGAQNRQFFKSKVQAAGANSGTPLETAIKKGYEALENQARRQLGYGEYHLVIVTDGEADMGEDPRQVVDYMINNTPIVVHTIGFCIKGGHSLNQPGRTIYKTADNPQELITGLKEVLAESENFSVSSFK